jgi:hypothetical protein
MSASNELDEDDEEEWNTLAMKLNTLNQKGEKEVKAETKIENQLVNDIESIVNQERKIFKQFLGVKHDKQSVNSSDEQLSAAESQDKNKSVKE